MEQFLARQNIRMKLLKMMMAHYNDGRSKAYYCRAAALLDVKILERSIERAAQKTNTEQIKRTDYKRKAMILRAILDAHLSKTCTS